jgi:hypothetical protein
MTLPADAIDIAGLRQRTSLQGAAGDFATAFPVCTPRAPLEATATLA